MIKLIILFVLIVSIFSLHIQRQHTRIISQQCCISQGGFQCGNVSKDCCALPTGVAKDKASSQLCIKGGLFGSSQYCPAQKIITQCDYCSNICESKGGKLCGWQNVGADQCCKEEDCLTDVNMDLKMKKCKPGTQIKLPNCIADMNLSDNIIGKIQGVVG